MSDGKLEGESPKPAGTTRGSTPWRPRDGHGSTARTEIAEDHEVDCPRCGARNRARRFCTRCGHAVEADATVRLTPTDLPDDDHQDTFEHLGDLEFGTAVLVVREGRSLGLISTWPRT